MAPVLDPLLTTQQSETNVLPSRISDPRGSDVARELIVLDSSVGDWRTLERSFADLTRGKRAEILVLSPEVDGIRAIHDKLAEMGLVDTLHLVTHGSAGSIGLGNSWLDGAALSARTRDLRDWQNYLTPGADMLLYGCDVAQGGMAESFLVDLGVITGTDIAASSDRTGSGNLHGDWDLEFTVGDVRATSLWTSTSAAGWRHLLATQVLYLDSTLAGSNASQMATSAPTATGVVPDFDGSDADPGRLLNRTNAGINEADADQHHTWRYGQSTANPAHLNGAATLKIWAASKDFKTNKRGGLQAWLIDEDTGGGQTTIATGQVQQAAWASTFTEATISFGNLNYSVAAGHTLVVKLIAPNSISNDDMWIAYDTAAQPSRLMLTIDPGFGNQDPQADSYTISEDNTLTVTGGTGFVGWQARRQITFNNASRAENLQDFPVLVRLDASTIDYRLTQDAGQDLRFVDGDGTVLAHEIERWDENGMSLVWVRVPTITASTNGDFIWMYYGNASAADGQNAGGVWTGGYDAVYHLGENAIASGDLLADSSSHNFHGTNFESLNTAGMVGFGQEFDGVDDRIDLGANRAFLRGTSAATLSAWIAPDVVSGRRQIVGVSHGGSNTQSRASIELLDQNIVVQGRDFDAGINLLNTVVTNGNPLTAGAWHHVAAVIDYAGNSIKIYVDGVQQTTDGLVAFLNGDTPNTNPQSAAIGSDEDLSTAYYDGKADEVRIESAARSAQWINAQYASEAGSFTSFGGEERATGVAANDLSPVLEVATVELVDGVSHGTLSLSANGEFTYTPNANYSGADSFRYQLRSASGLSVPMVVSLTVTPVNDLPTASADRYSVAEGGTVTIAAGGLLTNDADEDGDPMSVVLVAGPANGTLTLRSDGGFTYLHDGSESATDRFTYLAVDSQGGRSTPSTVTINSTPINDAPVLVPVEATVSEGGVISVDWSSAVSDPDSVSFTGQIITGPTNGTATVLANGQIQYRHNGGESTGDLLLFRVRDAQGLSSNTVTLTFHVTPVNDAPILRSGLGSVAEGGTLTQNLLSLASDAEGALDPASFELVRGPSRGLVSFTSSGQLNYVHDGSESSADSFTFRIRDTAGTLSNIATFIVRVTPVNDAPTAVADVATLAEGGSLDIAVLANDSDPDHTLSASSIQLVSSANYGSVTPLSNGRVRYSHSGGETTSDTFQYRLRDGAGAFSSVVTVSLNITPVNDRPVAVGEVLSAIEDVPLRVTSSQLLLNDSDADGNPLTVSSILSVTNGTFVDHGDGTWTFSATSNFAGDALFRYRIADGQGGVATASATLRFAPVNDAPTGLTDSWTILEDEAIALGDHRVLANDGDVDGDAITARMLNGPSHGTMSFATNGDFTYIPAANFAGTDAFTYEAWDGQLSSGPVTVTLTIQEVNDAPTTSTIRLNVVEGGLSTPGNLLGLAADLEGDALVVTSVSASKSGDVDWRADGTFTFQHNGDEFPTERLSYAITDARGGIVQGEVLVSVTPVNDAPLSQPDTFGVFSNGALRLDASSLVANDVDAEGAVLRVAIVDQPQSGTLLQQPNGAFVYVPATGFVGADTFTYQASDGQISGAITTVTIAVAAPPVGNSGAGGVPAPVSAAPAPAPTNLPVIPLAEPKTIRTEESITDSSEIERVGDSGVRLNVPSANARIEIAASGTEADDLRLVSANVHERTTGITSATVPSHVMTVSLGTIDLASLEITTPVGAFMEGMAQELDSLRQDLSSTIAGTGVVTGGILVATSTFSVGYVIWAMRTGFLMASVLSSLPAWQTFDPVPLLNQMDDEGEVGDEDAAVEAMMDATE